MNNEVTLTVHHVHCIHMENISCAFKDNLYKHMRTLTPTLPINQHVFNKG